MLIINILVLNSIDHTICRYRVIKKNESIYVIVKIKTNNIMKNKNDIKIVLFVSFDLGGFLKIIKIIIIDQNITKITQPVISA